MGARAGTAQRWPGQAGVRVAMADDQRGGMSEYECGKESLYSYMLHDVFFNDGPHIRSMHQRALCIVGRTT